MLMLGGDGVISVDNAAPTLNKAVHMITKNALVKGSLLLFTLTLTACGGYTKAQYEQLNVGQSRADIDTILGKASECKKTLATEQCRWGDEKQFIEVIFLADRAVAMQHQGLD